MHLKTINNPKTKHQFFWKNFFFEFYFLLLKIVSKINFKKISFRKLICSNSGYLFCFRLFLFFFSSTEYEKDEIKIKFSRSKDIFIISKNKEIN